jgi:hypothetical protein
VVETRVKTDLIHDCDTSLAALLIQLHHRGGNVGGRDHIRLGTDSRLDDGSVESVWDERDHNIGLVQGSIEGGIVVDIEGDSLGVLEARGQGLGTLKGTAGDSDLDVSLAEDLNSGLGDYQESEISKCMTLEARCGA